MTVTVCPNAAFAASNAAAITAAKFLIFMGPIERQTLSYGQAFLLGCQNWGTYDFGLIPTRKAKGQTIRFVF